MDTFDHLKAIGPNAKAKPLLDKASIEPDAGVTEPGKEVVSAPSAMGREAKVRMMA